MTMSYFSEYHRPQDSVWLWKELHRCVVVTQLQQSLRPKDSKSLIDSYFSASLHDSEGIFKGQCSKQIAKNVYVLINNIHNPEYSYCYIFK